LAPGSTTINSGFYPTNSDGGRIGVTSLLPITGLPGAYFMCSQGILGKFAKQIDITLDDGEPDGGSLRATLSTDDAPSEDPADVETDYADSTAYTLCMGF